MTLGNLVAVVCVLILLLVGILSVVTAIRKLRDRQREQVAYGCVLLAPFVIWVAGTQSVCGLIGGLFSAPLVSIVYVVVRGWWSHLFVTLNMLLNWGVGGDGDGGRGS